MRSNTQSCSLVQIDVHLFCLINIKMDKSSYYWSQILWYDECYNYLVSLQLFVESCLGAEERPSKKKTLYMIFNAL